MSETKKSFTDFFYSREEGWGTGALFFLTGFAVIVLILILKKRS